MLKLDKKMLVAVAVLVGLFVLFAYVPLTTKFMPLSPDTNALVFFGTQLAEKGSFSYYEPLNDRYDTTMFVPRGAVYSPSAGAVVPLRYLGLLLLTGFTWQFARDFYFLGAIFGILGIVFLYYLLRELFANDSKLPLLACLLVGILPMYAYCANGLSSDIGALAFMLGGMLYLLRLGKDGRIRNLVVSALLFAVAIWLRYDFVVYTVLFYFIFSFRFGARRALAKRTLLFACVLLIFCSPILLLNKQLYGDYLRTGYHLMQASQEGATAVLLTPSFAGSATAALDNFVKYFVMLIPVYALLGFSGLVKLLVSGPDSVRRLCVFFILAAVFSLAYFGTGEFYGIKSELPELGHSYVRYYLILYTFLAVFAAYFIVSVLRHATRPWLVPLLVSVIVILSFAGPLGSKNIQGVKLTMEKYQRVQQNFLEDIPEDAVVFSRYWEKIIFPHRTVANYMIIEEDARMQEVARTMRALLNDGGKVYFLEEGTYYSGRSFEDYKSYLELSGFELVHTSKRSKLYQVQLKSD